MSYERDAQRGRLAEEVLNNPVYVEAYDQAEQEVIRKWRAARDFKDREQLHQFLMMLEAVKNTMETAMRSGKVAELEIQRRSLKDRLSRPFRTL